MDKLTQETFQAAKMADKIVSRMLKANIETTFAELNLSQLTKNKLFKVLRLSEPCFYMAVKNKFNG